MLLTEQVSPRIGAIGQEWSESAGRCDLSTDVPVGSAIGRIREPTIRAKQTPMKLSSKSRYGMRAMLHLALTESDGVVMSRSIAESQNLPETYLEQLMLSLRRAGLLTAIRGSKGGYLLARKPEDISLAEIVEAMDGPISIAECSEVANCCYNPTSCALKDAFAEVNGALVGALEGISLADLAARQKNKEAACVPMYYI